MTKEANFQGFLDFSELSPELQEIANKFKAGDVCFFHDNKKKIKNVVLAERIGYIWAAGTSMPFLHSFEGAVGKELLKIFAHALCEPNMELNMEMIKTNLRLLADALEPGSEIEKELEADKQRALKAHRAFQRGEAQDTHDIDWDAPDGPKLKTPPAPFTNELVITPPEVTGDSNPKTENSGPETKIEGVVLSVGDNSFWGRLISPGRPDEECEFNISDVLPAERDRILPGGKFTFITKESLCFEEPGIYSAEDIEAAREKAKNWDNVLSENPDTKKFDEPK